MTTHSKRTPARLATIAAIFFLAAQPVMGTLIYSQDFESLDTGDLHNQAGFTVDSGTRTYTVVDTGGLSYTSGSVAHGGGDQRLILSRTNGGLFSAAHVSFTPTDADEVYFSFLFRYASASSSNSMFFALSDSVSLNKSAASVFVGSPNSFQARVYPDSPDFADAETDNFGSPAANTTYLMVGRVSKTTPGGNYNRLELLANPDSLTAPATWGGTVDLDMTIDELDRLYFFIGGSSNDFQMDDIRVGTSYDSVVIPEPGTLVLLGIALGAAFLATRRRK
ncbi:MAG: PEP-CTERM sorting domain-containing protein [Verrucomicrobia bacterium]|nr:PEP-CTERM sorting domain-containing protein [Verrucomicrobiota bacterium]MCH8511984.1 PEP-CTERM sorting domain-containing protein [Kiritimatiellia bacterium]